MAAVAVLSAPFASPRPADSFAHREPHWTPGAGAGAADRYGPHGSTATASPSSAASPPAPFPSALTSLSQPLADAAAAASPSPLPAMTLPVSEAVAGSETATEAANASLCDHQPSPSPSPPAAWEDAMAAQLAAWFAAPAWPGGEAAPDMRVSVGDGALCQLDGDATVGLPPDAVFSIVCDPFNRRVFKNIKAVRNLVVVSEVNGVKVEEMDMTFVFQLPFFAGTFDAHVRMVKDRRNRKMSFGLTRPGFMRRFEGHWTVEPLAVGDNDDDASDPPSSNSSSSGSSGGSSGSSGGSSGSSTTPSRVASRLVLHQVVQPSLAPPAIFKRCLHTLLQMATSDVLKVFQEEARRVRANGEMPRVGDEGEGGGEEGRGEGADRREEKRSSMFLHREALGAARKGAAVVAKGGLGKKMMLGKKK